MKASILSKLEILSARYEEIAGLLSDIEVINDQNRFRTLSMEYSQLEDVVKTFTEFQNFEQDKLAAEEMLKEEDAEMREMAEEEINEAKQRMEELEMTLQKQLLPKDPNDNSNVFLEIRAGTGGDEAAIFAGDLFRMYSRYAENKRWQIEVLNSNLGEHGGYKEIIARIIGAGAFSNLKFESGAHRVQRVPETESRDGCILRRPRWRSFPKQPMWKKLTLTRPICGWILFVPRALVVSTLIKPIRLFA